jgi:flagellar basal body-associated protein FliL
VKLGKKTILLMGLPVGLAVVGGLAMMTLGGSKAAAAVPDPKPGQHGFMLALDERVINLKQTGPAAYHYAKVGLTVEVRPESGGYYDFVGKPRAEADKELVAAYAPDVPLLLDALGSVVSARDSGTIGSVEGRAALKADLLAQARQILGQDAVLDIYFTDLVMQ